MSITKSAWVVLSVFVLSATTLIVASYKGWIEPQQTVVQPTVDYLWVFEQTNIQDAAKGFKQVCERELNTVRQHGLGARELRRNNLNKGNITNSKLVYDFDYIVHENSVGVKASCSIQGHYQENVFRTLQFTTEKISGEYILTK